MDGIRDGFGFEHLFQKEFFCQGDRSRNGGSSATYEMNEITSDSRNIDNFSIYDIPVCKGEEPSAFVVYYLGSFFF